MYNKVLSYFSYMKKGIVLSLLALLGITQLAAQDFEYVPFVREGVKWVCYYENLGYNNILDPYYNPGRNYFTLEIKGDTIIDGKCYKAMHKYGGAAINTANDTIPLYLREQNHIVYGIAPEGHHYVGLMVGYGFYDNVYQSVNQGEEIVLYDFNAPEDYLSNTINDLSYLGYSYIELGNRYAKRHRFYIGDCHFLIIEGVGFDEEQFMTGYTLGYAFSSLNNISFHLSHVMEGNEIIYKGTNYKEPQPEQDDYEYVPFVREGVKWVYYYDNPFTPDVLDMDSYIQYYSFEMKGDVEIGGKHYKQVSLTHYFGDNTKEVEDFVPVYLREENKVVYAIHPDGREYPQCPVGISRLIDRDYSPNTSNDEFILYDFNDPNALYDSINIYGEFPIWITYQYTDTITFGNHHTRCHHYKTAFGSSGKVIEGIGYDGFGGGMPLCYFNCRKLKLLPLVEYYLSHVIEDGEIIYKGLFYDPQIRVGINETMADRTRRNLDPQYYNLMGQPVGKDVPTTPGIYIHQGKKICVSRTP